MSRAILVKTLPATETLVAKYVISYEMKKDIIMPMGAAWIQSQDRNDPTSKCPVQQVAEYAMKEWGLDKLLETQQLQVSQLPPRINAYGKVFDSVVTMTDIPKNLGVEINRELVLSTAHVTEETRKDFELSEKVTGIEPYKYGYRIWVDITEVNGKSTNDYPELANLLVMAKGLNCKWLVLDMDAEPVKGLKQFEW